MRNLIDDSSMKEVLGDLAVQLSRLGVAAPGRGEGQT
jgi:hypothetical protein